MFWIVAASSNTTSPVSSSIFVATVNSIVMSLPILISAVSPSVVVLDLTWNVTSPIIVVDSFFSTSVMFVSSVVAHTPSVYLSSTDATLVLLLIASARSSISA